MVFLVFNLQAISFETIIYLIFQLHFIHIALEFWSEVCQGFITTQKVKLTNKKCHFKHWTPVYIKAPLLWPFKGGNKTTIILFNGNIISLFVWLRKKDFMNESSLSQTKCTQKYWLSIRPQIAVFTLVFVTSGTESCMELPVCCNDSIHLINESDNINITLLQLDNLYLVILTSVSSVFQV